MFFGPHLALFGPFWPFLALFGPFWALFGAILGSFLRGLFPGISNKAWFSGLTRKKGSKRGQKVPQKGLSQDLGPWGPVPGGVRPGRGPAREGPALEEAGPEGLSWVWGPWEVRPWGVRPRRRPVRRASGAIWGPFGVISERPYFGKGLVYTVFGPKRGPKEGQKVVILG